MRLLVHRTQALLLLVVGGLAGAVLAGAVLERNGLPDPMTTRAAELLASRPSHLPVRIEIARPDRAPADGASAASREAGRASSIAALEPSVDEGTPSAAPTPATTVVPPTVYAYPPDDRGRGPGGSSGGGRR